MFDVPVIGMTGEDSTTAKRNSRQHDQEMEEAMTANNVPERFLFNTVMVPFSFGRWVKVMALHFSPYFFMLWNHKMPELHAMGFHLQFDTLGGFCRGFIFNHLPVLLLYAQIVVYSMLYQHGVFADDGHMTMMVYSYHYVPVSQLVGWAWFIPTLLLVVHRAAIANKYASLSDEEYSRYLNVGSAAEVQAQIASLNILFMWNNTSGRARLQYEVVAASTRAAVDPFETYFHLADPLCDYHSFNNFRHWQAFLLQKESIVEYVPMLHYFSCFSPSKYVIESRFDMLSVSAFTKTNLPLSIPLQPHSIPLADTHTNYTQTW